ncbi:MAG: dual specificity protein phosphatase family protein [Anaerolineae bacterium]|nr:dual specificity protein phosphatase family protein [Anaerolineae bacterium]
MSEKQRVEPKPEFYTVVPDKLLAGSYPGGWNQPEQRAKLHRLLGEGVTLFVDLTEEGELRPYVSLLVEEASALGLQVAHRRLPIPDFNVPTAPEMKSILDTIDQTNDDGGLVYVHCRFGIGRTGTVVGCYLVRHGLSGVQALEELVHLRQGTYLEGMLSPITPEQRQMVQDWPVGA